MEKFIPGDLEGEAGLGTQTLIFTGLSSPLTHTCDSIIQLHLYACVKLYNIKWSAVDSFSIDSSMILDLKRLWQSIPL